MLEIDIILEAYKGMYETPLYEDIVGSYIKPFTFECDGKTIQIPTTFVRYTEHETFGKMLYKGNEGYFSYGILSKRDTPGSPAADMSNFETGKHTKKFYEIAEIRPGAIGVLNTGVSGNKDVENEDVEDEDIGDEIFNFIIKYKGNQRYDIIKRISEDESNDIHALHRANPKYNARQNLAKNKIDFIFGINEGGGLFDGTECVFFNNNSFDIVYAGKYRTKWHDTMKKKFNDEAIAKKVSV